jgi:signal transduction histidine kinase
VEVFSTVAESEGMILSGRITPDLQVSGDRELLAQMLVNIIENAIRHCAAGTQITISAEKLPADQVGVTVSDNGPGIPFEDHERVLKRFVKLDMSLHSDGSGLGLALVAAVADLHHARIRLANANPGLAVAISLPRLQTRPAAAPLRSIRDLSARTPPSPW